MRATCVLLLLCWAAGRPLHQLEVEPSASVAEWLQQGGLDDELLANDDDPARTDSPAAFIAAARQPTASEWLVGEEGPLPEEGERPVWQGDNNFLW